VSRRRCSRIRRQGFSPSSSAPPRPAPRQSRLPSCKKRARVRRVRTPAGQQGRAARGAAAQAAQAAQAGTRGIPCAASTASTSRRAAAAGRSLSLSRPPRAAADGRPARGTPSDAARRARAPRANVASMPARPQLHAATIAARHPPSPRPPPASPAACGGYVVLLGQKHEAEHIVRERVRVCTRQEHVF
jgi:hypothetical protein